MFNVAITVDMDNDFENTIGPIRERNPGQGIILYWDEVEQMGTHRLVQLLDGDRQVDNVLYLMATNEPSELPSKVITRARRLNMHIHFIPPTLEARYTYFQMKMETGLIEDMDISEMAEKTDGMSLDQCAQVIVSMATMGKNIEWVIEDIKTRQEIVNGQFDSRM